MSIAIVSTWSYRGHPNPDHRTLVPHEGHVALPVEVLDGVEGEVEHDDVLDKRQVQPTRRHVRAHHELHLWTQNPTHDKHSSASVKV